MSLLDRAQRLPSLKLTYSRVVADVSKSINDSVAISKTKLNSWPTTMDEDWSIPDAALTNTSPFHYPNIERLARFLV